MMPRVDMFCQRDMPRVKSALWRYGRALALRALWRQSDVVIHTVIMRCRVRYTRCLRYVTERQVSITDDERPAMVDSAR